MLTVHMVGLMHFNACHDGERRVYVPNGTQGMDEIPPHYASLWIEEDKIDKDDWFSWHKFDHEFTFTEDNRPVIVHVTEYRIPYPVELSFPDQGDDADCSHLGTYLPKVRDLDPGFVVDTTAPETIAQIPIHSGQLKVFKFQEVRVVRWDFENSSLVITANDGIATRSIIVKDTPELGTQIVFGNTSDLLKEDNSEDEPNHLKLYSKIKVGRRFARLRMPKGPEDVIDSLQFDHAYLATIKPHRLPAPGCEATCC